MVGFNGKPAEVTQVVDGLHIIDVLPKTIVCGCCIENVERIKFKNQSFVPERTCTFSKREKIGDPYPTCSACGYETDWHECEWYMDDTFVYEKPFCPNCGAKVVE